MRSDPLFVYHGFMEIRLPHTLTAEYSPDAFDDNYYDNNGSGHIVLMFGGWMIKRWRIDSDGSRFESGGHYYRSQQHAEESISEFVAKKLKDLFKDV